jgi:hypothetical protein
MLQKRVFLVFRDIITKKYVSSILLASVVTDAELIPIGPLQEAGKYVIYTMK